MSYHRNLRYLQSSPVDLDPMEWASRVLITSFSPAP